MARNRRAGQKRSSLADIGRSESAPRNLLRAAIAETTDVDASMQQVPRRFSAFGSLRAARAAVLAHSRSSASSATAATSDAEHEIERERALALEQQEMEKRGSMYIPPVSSVASAIVSNSPSPRRPSKSTTAAARAAAAATATAGGGKQLNRRSSLAGRFAVYMNRKAIAADRGAAGKVGGAQMDELEHNRKPGASVPLAGALSPRTDEHATNLFQIGAVVLKHGRRGRPVSFCRHCATVMLLHATYPCRTTLRRTRYSPRIMPLALLWNVLLHAAHARYLLPHASTRVD